MLKHAARTSASSEEFAAANEAEISNLELQVSSDDLLNWEETARAAKEAGFRYAVKFPTSLEVPEQAVENCVKLCAVLNCDTLVIHEPMFRKFGSRIAELAPGLNLAVENNRFNKVRFDEWAGSNDKLTLDVEHFWKFTLNDAPLEVLLEELGLFLQKYGEKLQQVHLSGYQPGQPVHRPMYCNRDMVFSVLSLLAETGFDGFIVSEVSEEYLNRRDLVMDTLLIGSWQDQKVVEV
jgi:sugar phosphate isomerase/epimerase